MTTTNLGRIAIVPKGTWAAGSYKALDLVRYNGASYIAKSATTASPTDTTYWQLVNSDGATGATGATGPQGPAGTNGTGTVNSVAALTITTTGTDLTSTVANGTTTPVITINVPNASASARGVLTSTDWSTFNAKQAALVSGTNIKTINGNSILGSGDITISGGGGGVSTGKAIAMAIVFGG